MLDFDDDDELAFAHNRLLQLLQRFVLYNIVWPADALYSRVVFVPAITKFVKVIFRK